MGLIPKHTGSGSTSGVWETYTMPCRLLEGTSGSLEDVVDSLSSLHSCGAPA